jgi:hypothetical protein
MAWTDTNSGTTTTNQSGSSTCQGYKVTLSSGGTCDKLRIWASGNGRTGNVKLALYQRTNPGDRGYTLIGYSSAAGALANSATPAEVQLSVDRDGSGSTVSGVTVSAGTYYILFHQDGNSIYYKGTNVADQVYRDIAYASFPAASMEYVSEDGDINFRLGMNVESSGASPVPLFDYYFNNMRP